MRPTRRHDWPRAVGLLGLIIGAVATLITGNWVALMWIFVATLYAVSDYHNEKTAEVWKIRYLDVKAQRDRATWGGHLP